LLGLLFGHDVVAEAVHCNFFSEFFWELLGFWLVLALLVILKPLVFCATYGLLQAREV